MRQALTGGLSIVFTSMAVSWVTKIRPHQVKNPETCQQILGVDSNSLYLASIREKCPTDFFVSTPKKIIFLQTPVPSIQNIVSAMAKLYLCPKKQFHPAQVQHE